MVATVNSVETLSADSQLGTPREGLRKGFVLYGGRKYTSEERYAIGMCIGASLAIALAILFITLAAKNVLSNPYNYNHATQKTLSYVSGGLLIGVGGFIGLVGAWMLFDSHQSKNTDETN